MNATAIIKLKLIISITSYRLLLIQAKQPSILLNWIFERYTLMIRIDDLYNVLRAATTI